MSVLFFYGYVGSVAVLGGENCETALRSRPSVTRQRGFYRGQEATLPPRSRGRLRYALSVLFFDGRVGSVAVLGGVNCETASRSRPSVTRQRAFHRGQEVTLAPRSRGRLRYELAVLFYRMAASVALPSSAA